MNIESSLRKQLSEIKIKKDSLVSEQKYIERRFSNLLESYDLSNQKDFIIFRSELIKEIRNLKENGLLNEQTDMGNILGNLGYLGKRIGKSVWDRLFIGFYKDIAKNLGFDTNTFLFNTIVEGFQMLEWGDIIKILGGDCDLLTVKLTSAIMSGLSKKIADKMNMAGPGHDILRMALIQGISDDPNSPVGKIVQQNLSPLVCKQLENWLGKVESKGEQLKKAEQTKKGEPSTNTKQSTPDVLGSVKKAIGL
jgi:hypothetical protein